MHYFCAETTKTLLNNETFKNYSAHALRSYNGNHFHLL